MNESPHQRLVVCVDNADYPAALEKRKIYVAIPDSDADREGLLRVVDESGEDYLYPRDLFRPIELPQALKAAILATL